MMGRFLAIVLAVALSSGCSPPEERAARAREATALAIAQGDRFAALDAIDALRDTADDGADAQLEIAQLLVHAGNAPEAGWLLEEVWRRYPKRADVGVALANVSLLLGNPARARDVANAITPDTEQHLAALVLRAQAELGLGDLDRALTTLAEAEAGYPDRPEARLVRIATLLSEDKKEEARVAIQDARNDFVADDATSVAMRRQLDLTYVQLQAELGETEAALAGIDALLTADPTDPMAWQALVRTLTEVDRAVDALARIEAALATDQRPAELHALAARLHARMGLDGAAEAALRNYQQEIGSAAAYQPLIAFHSSKGNAEALLAVLDEGIVHFRDDPTLRLQRTEALLGAGRLSEAREEAHNFRDATFHDDPQLEYLDARFALADGDAQDAAQQLTRLAPKLDRGSTQFWIGRALEESGDLEGARRRYAHAQQREPTWSAPLSALVSLEERRGNWPAVVGSARALAALAPHDMSAWWALVNALEHLGEGVAAEKVARQFLERFPDRAAPHILLAKALRIQANTDEALKELAKAERFGEDATIAAVRIRTLGMAARIEQGLAAARAAVARYPNAHEVHAARAVLLFASGSVADGEQATDRAMALAPDQPGPLRERCIFRASTRNWAGALDDCARYLAARSEDAEVTFIRGVVLQRLSETDAAIAAYRRAATLDERDARPHNNLAGILAAEGDLDGALASAQAAYRLDETNPYVMDTLGALYLEAGLVERAISVLTDANAGAPDLLDAQLHLALAYHEVGRDKEAHLLLVAVLESDDTTPALRARAGKALDALPAQ